jgi:hypothetical protein
VLANEHWTDGQGGRRARVLRSALLDRVLRHFGLEAQEWGGRYVVRDRKGRSLVADDLTAVWAACEQLAGLALDPLDTTLVASLVVSLD